MGVRLVELQPAEQVELEAQVVQVQPIKSVVVVGMVEPEEVVKLEEPVGSVVLVGLDQVPERKEDLEVEVEVVGLGLVLPVGLEV